MLIKAVLAETLTWGVERSSTLVKVPLPATLPRVSDTKPPAVAR